MIWDSQHGCPKDKSCTNLLAYYNSVNTLVHEAGAKEMTTDVTYLDLCKASDTVQHDIPISKFERHGFDGWTTWWIRNCLDDHTQRIVINNTMPCFNLLLTLKIHKNQAKFCEIIFTTWKCSKHSSLVHTSASISPTVIWSVYMTNTKARV